MSDINVQNINLEKLIELWNKGCEYELSLENYERAGNDDFPLYSIKMTENVSIVISIEDTPVVRMVFSGYLTYKKFELTDEQFRELESLHEKAIYEKQRKLNENAVKRGEYELNILLNAIETSNHVSSPIA